MFRKIALFLLIVLFSGTFFQAFRFQDMDYAQAKSKKVPIVELFTAEWCGYCPPANKALDELMDEFGGRVFIPIKHHGQGNGGMNNSYANSRMSRFGIRGFPTTVVDGRESINARDKTAIKQKVTMMNMQTIDTDISFNGKIEKGRVLGEVKYTNAPGGSALHVVVCEAYYYFRGSNGEKVHRMISRDGQSTEASYDGTFSVNMAVPSSMAEEMVRLVIFIENNQGVAQSMYWNPSGTDPKANDVILSSIPNELDYSVQREGFSTSFDITLSNFSPREAVFKLTCKDSFVQFQNAEVSVSKESQSKTQVSLRANALKAGTYSTQIEVTSTNYKKSIPIRFTLVENPELHVNLDNIDFGEVRKGQRARATITIENKKKGFIKGSVSSRSRWLEFDPREFDAEKQEITVFANSRDLTAGTHEADIQINSDGGQARIKAEIFVSASHLEADKDRVDLGEVTEDKLAGLGFSLNLSNKGTETAEISIEKLPDFVTINEKKHTLEPEQQMTLEFLLIPEKTTINQLNEGEILINYTDGSLSVPVKIHAKEMPPTLQMTAEGIKDNAISFELSPSKTASFEITVENIGKGRLEGKVLFLSKQKWIKTSHDKFALLNGQRRTIVVSIDTAEMKKGTYEEIVSIQTNGGKEEIQVNIVISKDPIVIELQIGSRQANVSGNPVTVDPPPYIKKGTTLVPLRFIIEAFGAEIEWQPRVGKGTIIILLDDYRIQIEIGNPLAYVNGKSMTLTVPPEIVNGRTFVPLRFISEAFGAKVEWIAASQTIIITYQN